MKISQREARRLRKKVAELRGILESQDRWWSSEWPGGTNIATISLGNLPHERGRIEAARMLKHAVVAVMNGEELRLYAKPLPKF